MLTTIDGWPLALVAFLSFHNGKVKIKLSNRRHSIFSSTWRVYFTFCMFHACLLLSTSFHEKVLGFACSRKYALSSHPK